MSDHGQHAHARDRHFVAGLLLGWVALAGLTLPCPAGQEVTATETVVRLVVRPMAAPRPALRYLLLPELNEMTPGNPVPGYIRSALILEQSLANQQAAEHRQRLLGMPLDRLPARELQDYGGTMLRLADRAARMDRPDWQILPNLKAEGIALLLPDLQPLRNMAQSLQLRFRAEVALHRYDDAIGTAKTMFAIARHLGEHPTLVANLVGMAIANMAVVPLEEMLEQPGCPNLYWALTDLPSPLVSVERATKGERLWMLGTLHNLDEKAPMTKEQLADLVAILNGALAGGPKIAGKYKSVREWLNARTADEAFVHDARRRLIEGGMAPELVAQFPARQVVLLDDRRLAEIHRDEVTKLMNLPAWQMEALVGPWKSLPFADPAALDGFLSAFVKVRWAQTRLEQRLALLRHVEALRLYAADHGGTLPGSPADTGVPLPPDPFTGKPFLYKVEGTKAHLRGSPPPDLEKNPAFNVRYEVSLATEVHP
jgi:hypothetical protein